MNNPWTVIQTLNSDNSRLAKEEIIKQEAEAGNDVFFEGCRLALDPMITFGVKQISEKVGNNGNGLDWNYFRVAIDKLANRSVTGLAAQHLISELINESTEEQWNHWYRLILIKDLRCGVSEKTVNKVVEKKYAQYNIPVFNCQLAHDSSNHETKVAGRKLIETKLDGVRVITIVYPNGRVDQFSRNGKELVNFEHIKNQISQVVLKEPPPYPVVLDGEVMSSSFQDLMKQVHRKSDVKANDAVLNLFDFIPLADFEKGFWNKSQTLRSQMLTAWVEKHSDDLPEIGALSQELVDLDTEEGKLRFKEINQQAIDGGYEGIMIKDPDAGYECKRSVAWLKLKPFIEVSLTVKSVEEGTGRNIGKLGALVCEGVDDDKTILVNVGSGFTDADRDNYWIGKEDVINRIVEVRADAITQNQDGSYSLRFPRFLRFRGFEAGEKI
jgi:DNA ligase 1